MGARQPVEILDPHIHYDWSTRMIHQMVYDALVKYVDNPPQIIPWVAESWDAADGGRVWTFRLNPAARFHNGDPVDAEAVAYSFRRCLTLGRGPSWMLDGFLEPDGIEVVNATTVRFNLVQPYAAFLAVLPWWYIVNPNEVQAHEQNGDWGSAWLREPPHSAGSGPFRIEEWRFGESYHLTANDGYWRGWPREDHISGFELRLIREGTSQRLALERGEVHIAEGLSPRDFTQVAEHPQVYVAEHPGWTAFGFKMNTQVGPTADVNVRKAISYAFDYDSFLAIYQGRTTLMDSPFPKGLQGYTPVDSIYRLDLDKAREHLEKSEYAGGGFTLDYYYISGMEEERQAGLVLGANLARIGINLNIVASTWPEMVALGSQRETSPSLMAVFVTPSFNDPDAVAFQYHRRSWGNYYGTHFYDNPKAHELIDRGRRVLEWEQRAEIYAELQRILVDDAPEIFGHCYNRRWALRKELQGLRYSPVHLTSEVDPYFLYFA